MAKKIIITGAGGVLGQALITKLCEQDFKVIGVTRNGILKSSKKNLKYISYNDFFKIDSEQIMNLRNHSTHPYKNGNLESPHDSNICEIFAYNDKLKFNAIHTLCNCLDEVLIILLLQKLGIDKYYKKF